MKDTPASRPRARKTRTLAFRVPEAQGLMLDAIHLERRGPDVDLSETLREMTAEYIERYLRRAA